MQMKPDLNCEDFNTLVLHSCSLFSSNLAPENKWLDLMNCKCYFDGNENLKNLNPFLF